MIPAVKERALILDCNEKCSQHFLEESIGMWYMCTLICHNKGIFHIFTQVDMHDMYSPTHLRHPQYACHSSQRQEACQWYVKWRAQVRHIQQNVVQ